MTHEQAFALAEELFQQSDLMAKMYLLWPGVIDRYTGPAGAEFRGVTNNLADVLTEWAKALREPTNNPS